MKEKDDEEIRVDIFSLQVIKTYNLINLVFLHIRPSVRP